MIPHGFLSWNSWCEQQFTNTSVPSMKLLLIICCLQYALIVERSYQVTLASVLIREKVHKTANARAPLTKWFKMVYAQVTLTVFINRYVTAITKGAFKNYVDKMR